MKQLNKALNNSGVACSKKLGGYFLKNMVTANVGIVDVALYFLLS